MHPYHFLQSYGPSAVVFSATSPLGTAFAGELAKGGFDLLLPCSRQTELSALAARLEDHEGVNVDVYEASVAATDFAEQLGRHAQASDIGLWVFPGQLSNTPGSLLTSLTRVFMPHFKRRSRSGLVLVDTDNTLARFTDTLSRELVSVDVDVLRLRSHAPAGAAADAGLPKQMIEELGESAPS